MAFVDLEKAFDRVPLWWTLRVAGVPEWLVKIVQVMYVGARSRTCLNGFLVKNLKSKLG